MDELLSYEEWSYDASGTTWVRYLAPGADGVWHTEDDVASGRTEWRRDAEGWWETRESFGPGADGILGTEDDRLSSRAEYQVID